MTFRCRFAPSPNGRLHLGHAYSALVNHDAAQRSAGRFLLRIEDIDATRSRPEFVAGIREDLQWLGVLPQEPPRHQSGHLPAYADALARLRKAGLLYPAFESRAEIAAEVRRRDLTAPWPRDPDGAPLYPFSRTSLPDSARQRRLAEGAPHVLRLHMDAALEAAGDGLSWQEAPGDALAPPEAVRADPAAWGDVILARRDVPGSYHLCVVIDDAQQEISHVIRGADLKPATAVHRLLQRLLGLPAPIYHHHGLILDADGRKLSKSAGSTSLAELRQSGATPGTVRARLGFA
ncbi:tRNA glutamyl-Q(34) synthetase GluQRS [Aquabacter sp. L1I39]|uniref:tRNA glutamyl-Q(34) synthetase GluQRS n=1 Tax=Aquabacter sp. L1I39 TaxID=2820278 RepID=UPI001ADB7B74|nr:tRNA glutamyl-Q(34) synthetase GluQRS [Aquabacter sp. L1I39]QTL02834.1 tRNA glutamyl-Q(34) synthetase GluQRS [Aquabacter sp. L1I39]